jgi:hypothetical protein
MLVLPRSVLTGRLDRRPLSMSTPIDDVRGGGEIGVRGCSIHCGAGLMYGLLSTLTGVRTRSSCVCMIIGLRGAGGENSCGDPGTRARRGGGGRPCVGDAYPGESIDDHVPPCWALRTRSSCSRSASRLGEMTSDCSAPCFPGALTLPVLTARISSAGLELVATLMEE